MSAVSSRQASRNHSPARSPTRLMSAGGPFSVNNSLSTLKSLNSGWQVWSGTHPRNTPGSSITSAQEISPPRSDAAQRNGFNDWNSLSRPTTSRSWDEVHDHLRIQESTTRGSQTALGQAALVSIPRMEQTLGLKSALGSSNSPTRAYGGYQKSPVSATFDSLQRRSPNVDDLSSAMRGMVVEEDHIDLQRQAALNLQSRSQLTAVNGTPYTLFPQADINSTHHQALQSAREPSFNESPFSYDPYRPSTTVDPVYSSASSAIPNTGTLYPTIAVDPHRRPSFVYDYSLSARPAPQYFYPSQGLLYSQGHSPLTTPQVSHLSSANSLSNTDKVELQYAMLHTPMLPPLGTPVMTHPVSSYNSSMDHNSSHLGPFGAAHLGQYLSVNPMYSNGMLPYPNNLRPGSVTRSTLLEEFRNRKSRKWELSDIVGHILEFSMDQYGSRFIQTKLENAGLDKIRMIYDEIVPTYAFKLMTDVFGNYVIQKLMDFGTQEQRSGLARIVENEIVDLSLNVYGCRVVQKVIELCTAEQQTELVRRIEPQVLTVVKDTNGNHVIQKFIMTVPPERLLFLKAFRDAARHLAVHPYGCRVLQRCLEYLPNDYCRGIIDELHDIVGSLMQDQFGNYVVQYVLQHGQQHDCVIIAAQMKGIVLKLSRHKFASNVVEKVLVYANSETRRRMMDEILDTTHGSDPVHIMMMDAYGNYVIQTALNQVEADQKEQLYSRVRSQLIHMKREPRPRIEAKHIVAIERLLLGEPREDRGGM